MALDIECRAGVEHGNRFGGDGIATPAASYANPRCLDYSDTDPFTLISGVWKRYGRTSGGAMSRSEHTGFLYATIGTLIFATTPVFVRWAAPLSPYEITEGRLMIGALLVYSLMILRGERFLIDRGRLPQFAVFGMITALHFLFYIASLSFTTIAHSLAIVYTAPIFVTIFSGIFLGEPIPLRKWAGVVVAVIGIAIMVGFEPNFTRRMFLGDLMALGSAIMFGFYSVMGRSQREKMPLFLYAASVYGLAALWMLPIAAWHFTPSGYSWFPVLSVLILGVFPLGIGHTLYNAALRRVHATYVNLIATQEVTGGVILGALILKEVPGLNAIVGVIISLVGIALVLV